ncbi:putative ribonuclease H-like domain-containing protein [Tanacetum coccineum]
MVIFHEKRMAKQAELNNNTRIKSSKREIRPSWNNMQRVNHKNQFVPTVVLTRTSKILVNTARASGTNNVSTARHDFNRQVVPTNAAMKVNLVNPLRTKFSYQKVNTAEVNAASAIGGKRETAFGSNQNGNSKKRISTGKDGVIRILPPVSPAEIHAVEKERKAKNILLMAIPKEHMRRFHGMDDAKEIWEAIRTRSLPPAWSNLAMTMRTKPDVDTLSIDDLYNNLRVFEQEIQVLALLLLLQPIFLKKKFLLVLLMKLFIPSFSSNQKTGLCYEDLEQIDDLDIEEMDINWQIAMIAIRMKKFYKKTGRRVRVDGKTPVGFDKKKLECFNCHNTGHFARECTAKGTHDGKKRRDSFYQHQEAGKQEKNQMGLLTMDDGIVNWGEHTEDEETNHALMAISSSRSIRTSSKHFVNPEYENSSVPPEVYVSTPITTNEKGVSAPKSKEVEPSCVSHIKTPRQPIIDQETPKVNMKIWNAMMERELGEAYSFTKKKCFVCSSLSHLIKDCDYYEKKMARETEVNKQRVFNTGNMVAKLVWTNIDRINHANQFVPRSIQLNTGRTNINSVRPRVNTVNSNVNTVRSRQPVPTRTSNSFGSKKSQDHPLKNMVDRGIFDSGCSGHMTGNKDQLEDFEEFNGGSVTFGGSKGYITGKGKIRVGNLDFDSVSFVKELGHFNLFSISQICDKQHKVLFTETECLVVSSDFKMPDENQILLKVPRHHNMYSFDMKTPTPAKGFACLIAKATSDESKLWHRRLGHINFKNLNKLVKGNLVRGLPSKVFKNDHTCVACHKGKQHRASCKAKLERLITEPLHTLHMDLFGPTSVKSINHASYCLVITDDCTRFSWVFFLASKDETSGILQNFIRQIENQLSHRVKIIRSDNGTEFKNRDMLEFCGNKGIKQEYSNARTPQQNGVAERMNRTLIEAARTMLADSLLPTTFWAEAVSTACYIFNRVRVTKPQNKTPYELLFGHKPIISYIRPFGCHVTILDTLSVLGKFDGKSDEGFLVGYSLNSKAYRVYNLVTKRVEVNLHVNFLEDKPNVKGVGYRWMFDIDYLTDSMNYIPVSLENQANPHAGASEVTNSAGTSQTPSSNSSEEKDEDVELIVVPSAVKNTVEKVETRKSSKNLKKDEFLTEDQQ